MILMLDFKVTLYFKNLLLVQKKPRVRFCIKFGNWEGGGGENTTEQS